MRVGLNPHKDKPQEKTEFIHQVIIPVFIPNHEGYFKDSFKILKLCLESLFATIHSRTFITIVNNGSDENIIAYLDALFQQKKIHELIHTQNIGKLNAILKGLVGNEIELVTIADSDVLFLSHWQSETNKVYSKFPKAGVVGIVPQYRAYTTKCENMLLENMWNKNMRFIPVKNPEALEVFYTSIGWDKNANPDYKKFGLGMIQGDFKTYVGSGHFVATYKKDMFDEVVTYIGYKMGGDSERYLDCIQLKKDYWRLTTYDNYAYHMGNVYEPWMGEVTFEADRDYPFESNFPTFNKNNGVDYFIKNHIFRKLFRKPFFRRWIYRHKQLPKEMIATY